MAFKLAAFTQSYMTTIGVVTTAFSGATTSIAIGAYAGVELGTGTSLIVTGSNGQSLNVVLSSALVRGATSLSITSVDFPIEIPIGSRITINTLNVLAHGAKKSYYAQQSIYLTAGTNGNDYLSAFGTSTYSVNSAVTLSNGDSKPNRWASQYGIFIAPLGCTLRVIRGTASSDAGTGDDCVISVWKITPNTDSTTNVTLTAIKQFTLTSQNNQNHVFGLTDAPTSNNSFAAGDVCFVSIRRTGTKAGGVKWYADVGLQFEE
jgi:hypothetical protein